MSNSAWLVIALGVVLVAIAGYSGAIVARAKRLERRLSTLRERSGRATH